MKGAARGRYRRASLRPLGGDCVHLGHHPIALRAVDGIVCELGNLRRESRPPALALSRLGDRLASGLSAGEPPLAGDVLQSAPAVSAKAKRKWVRGSHWSSVARFALRPANRDQIELRIRWVSRSGRCEFHLHLVPADSARFRDELAFLDRLRMDAGLAREYAELKRSLAARFQNDREGYTDGKSDFVARVLGLNG